MAGALVLTPNWDHSVEPFILRQIRMLEGAGVLEAIMTQETESASWGPRRIPVISLTPQGLTELKRYLSKSKAHAILCQYGTFAVRLESMLDCSSKRLFIHVHGYDTFESLCPIGYRDAFVRLAEKATILCPTRYSYRRLLGWGIAPLRLVVKPLGVEVPPSPIHRSNSTEVIILHLGRLVDCKSPDRTIRAFERACEQSLTGHLLMAGDGPLRAMCELMRVRSRWRDRIHMLGAVTAEQGVFLRQLADIFTLHSIQGELTGQVENFATAIVEAMAAALPVVSCGIGGIPEAVIDGTTGILVQPGSVEEQAEALLTLSRKPSLRHRMGRAGWQRAKDFFSLEREKKQLLRILDF